MKTISVLVLAAVLSAKAFSASGSTDWFAAAVPGCVHTAPGAPAKFSVQLAKPMSKRDLLKTLQAQSLFSTYQQNSGRTIQSK